MTTTGLLPSRLENAVRLSSSASLFRLQGGNPSQEESLPPFLFSHQCPSVRLADNDAISPCSSDDAPGRRAGSARLRTISYRIHWKLLAIEPKWERADQHDAGRSSFRSRCSWPGGAWLVQRGCETGPQTQDPV